MSIWCDTLRQSRPSESFLSRSEWMDHAEQASTGLMVTSPGFLVERYGHGVPGVCLSDCQTEAERWRYAGDGGVVVLLLRMLPHLTLSDLLLWSWSSYEVFSFSRFLFTRVFCFCLLFTMTDVYISLLECWQRKHRVVRFIVWYELSYQTIVYFRNIVRPYRISQQWMSSRLHVPESCNDRDRLHLSRNFRTCSIKFLGRPQN